MATYKAFDELIDAADRIGDYLVTLSKQDTRIRDDAEMHRLVEDLFSAVVKAKDFRHRYEQ